VYQLAQMIPFIEILTIIAMLFAHHRFPLVTQRRFAMFAAQMRSHSLIETIPALLHAQAMQVLLIRKKCAILLAQVGLLLLMIRKIAILLAPTRFDFHLQRRNA